MILNVSTEELRKCLDIVEKALPTRTTLPSINNILCHINGEYLTFSTTNLQIFIATRMKYNCSEKKKILLPPKIIEIIRYFPTDSVELAINWDNYRIDISGGTAKFHLYGAEPEDYPTTFDDFSADQKSVVKIDKSSFKNLLRETIFAASSEEARPAFNGIFFEFGTTYLSLTASNTYRLAVKKVVESTWALEEKNCLVPARAMRELLRILDDGSDYINISYFKNMVIFTFNNITFASRLLEEKYPDFGKVIPTEYKTRVHLESKVFDNTISRASLLAEGKNQAVHLDVSDNKLEVNVSSQEGSMEEVLPVNQVGENVTLFINARYILDFCKVSEGEHIIIDFHGKGGPVIFRIPEEDFYLYLVLPIKKVN